MGTLTKINRYFFEVSNELHDEVVSLHDFVLPTATALWNFRSVIDAELHAIPSPSATDLSRKYNKAPNTRGSIDLIVPFRDITWDNQRERLAEIALVNIIALYESWCEEVCTLFGRTDLIAGLQFPTNAMMSKGVRFVTCEIINGYSGPVESNIYPSLIKSKKILVQQHRQPNEMLSLF